MRKTIKKAISESVQDLLKNGYSTTFTERELQELGVRMPAVSIDSAKIKFIRQKTHVSQSVFAKLLNVSPSSIRQWEQGTRKPTGSTKVLLEVLEKVPHVLDYRMEEKIIRKTRAA